MTKRTANLPAPLAESDIIIHTTRAISRKDLADLLITVFETPVGGWFYVESYIKPMEPVPTDLAEYERWPYAWYPLVSGGETKIVEDYDSNRVNVHVLDLQRIRLGLQCMADKYPKHFLDFIEENYDAMTADTFLQCCLFGEEKYG